MPTLIDAAVEAVRAEILHAVRRVENDVDAAAAAAATDDDDERTSSSLFTDEVRNQEMRHLDHVLPAHGISQTDDAIDDGDGRRFGGGRATRSDDRDAVVRRRPHGGMTADPARRRILSARNRSSVGKVHRKFFAHKRQQSRPSHGAVVGWINRLGRRCSRGLASVGRAIERHVARVVANARVLLLAGAVGRDGVVDANQNAGTPNDDDVVDGANEEENLASSTASLNRLPAPIRPNGALFPMMAPSWMLSRGRTDRACSRALTMVRNRILGGKR
jgi:hypothetical protein